MPKKGSTFGGPAPVVEEQEDDEMDEKFSLDELEDALGNPYNDLPPVVRRRVDALKNLHKQYLGVQKQYQAEVAELERKYSKLYDPILDKRASIVNGAYEPTDEEAKVEKEEQQEGEEAPKLREAAPEDAEIKGIPQYWLTVMQTSQLVSESITESDEAALAYLKDIRVAELEGDKHGFTLTFHFAENPYFTNTSLTKTYTMDEDDQFGELIFDAATGTKIDWKAGKNLTVKQVKSKVKGKKGKPARIVTTDEPQASFFNFFNPPELQEDSEDADEIAAILETDFDIGCTFKDKLIPFSLLWFTGEAAEYDDDFDEYDDDEDLDEEGNEEDEDEDDEEDEPPRKGNKGGARGGAGHSFPPPPAKGGANAPAQPPQPECKQQ